MLSFKQYLMERKRTPEEVNKFLDNVRKHKKLGYDRDSFEHDGPEMTSLIKQDKYGPTSVDKGFEKRKVSVEKIPVDEIRTAQDTVSISGVRHAVKNFDKGEHSEVIHNPETDTYQIRNGNHRISAARLLGHTHITARVYREGKK